MQTSRRIPAKRRSQIVETLWQIRIQLGKTLEGDFMEIAAKAVQDKEDVVACHHMVECLPSLNLKRGDRKKIEIIINELSPSRLTWLWGFLLHFSALWEVLPQSWKEQIAIVLVKMIFHDTPSVYSCIKNELKRNYNRFYRSTSWAFRPRTFAPFEKSFFFV